MPHVLSSGAGQATPPFIGFLVIVAVRICLPEFLLQADQSFHELTQSIGQFLTSSSGQTTPSFFGVVVIVGALDCLPVLTSQVPNDGHVYSQLTSQMSSCVPVSQSLPAPTLSFTMSTPRDFFPVVGSHAPYGPHDQIQSPHGSDSDTQGAPPLSGKTSGIHGFVLVLSGLHKPHGVLSLHLQSIGGHDLEIKELIVSSRFPPLTSVTGIYNDGSLATSLK